MSMMVMARNVQEDIFSDTYLDAFYRAHVASRRGNIDEDIAAIEAEIRKVQRYQSRFRCYKWDSLNSCGSSECSDDPASGDEGDFYGLDASPTSVFKVYNSSTVKERELQLPRGPDVFSWALLQQVRHDHIYSGPEGADQQTTPIDHGTVHMKNVKWHQLSSSKRAQTVLKLSCILSHQPLNSDPLLPCLSSLDLLPNSLANCIRKTGTLGIGLKEGGGGGSKAKPTAMVTCQKIDIKEIKAKQRTLTHRQFTMGLPNGSQKSPSVRNTSRKRTRQLAHSAAVKSPRLEEFTRVRYSSTCSESEDPVVID